MATRAEIAAEVSANIGPFQKALDKALEGAHKFGEGVSEVGTDVGKNLTGIDIGKFLGLAGATVAAGLLAEKLIEVGREGLAAFATHETEVLSLKLNIKGATDEIAEGMIKTLEAMAGVGGTTAQLVSAFRSLKEAGLTDDKAIATIKDLQNEYVKTGVSVDDYAESLRKAQAGGADQGEGLQRLLKSMPDLAPMIQAKIDDARNSYLQSIGHGPGFATTALKPEEQAHLDLIPKTPEAYVKEHGLNFEELLKGIHQNAPADAMSQASETLAGKQATLAAKVEELSVTIGAALAPAMKSFLDEVIKGLPAFTEEVASITAAMGPPLLEALKAFGGALVAATNVLTKNQAKAGGEDVKFVSDLQSRGSLDVGGKYQYGHQPGEKQGESSMDSEKHLLADMFDEARFALLKNTLQVVPETMTLQRDVEARNVRGGVGPDGTAENTKATQDNTNALRAFSKTGGLAPQPGDIDY